MEAYKKAGIGGLELTPIYGVKGDEENYLPYLSSEWVEMLEFTLQEAERLGLGVDMATGTGWPFGGPWVGAETACRYIAHKEYKLLEGQKLNEKIEFIQKPILRTVNNPKLKFEQLTRKIADNDNLQKLALDQVRFQEALPLETIIAFSENGEHINLTNKVKDGQLNWTAPAGNWTVYVLFQGWHGKMVERSAPGGEGNVIDHFSKTAIENYLAKFDESFSGKQVSSLRAFFNDSYEVDDAVGQADWTPQLFEAFKTKRGYDLQDHLPALFGNDSVEKNLRIKSDYRETVADLLFETFTQGWAAWAGKNGAVIRNQAHGSPANILDLYAASDIPETEGTDIIKAKMASSAAHVAQRPLVSAEAATWLGEHFTTNLADLKQNVDRYFAAGINHIFYHGTTYSPPGDVWPGRLFYAAIHANPRNPLWEDYPVFNQYVERTQSFLQAGQPDSDILLYFPAYDRYAATRKEMLEHFDGEASSKHEEEKTPVRKIADVLHRKGYAFDFISDKQIVGLEKVEGGVKCGDIIYKSIVVPPTDYMPLATLKKIQLLSESGIPVIFHEALPNSVPGFSQLDERKQLFSSLIEALKKNNATVNNILLAEIEKANLPRETLTDHGLDFNRRKVDGGKVYFISNWSEDNFNGWVELSGAPKSVAIFDPMTGAYGMADHLLADEHTQVKLQINRGASIILKTFDSATEGKKWHYFEKLSPPNPISGKWKIDFLTGGPELPSSIEMEKLALWTDRKEEPYQFFSGTATYTINFPRPEKTGNHWRLDLGEVEESASVKLNGEHIGTTIGPVHQLHFANNLLKDQNTLEVSVSNSMGNRIISMEKSGKRWQKFYNINISARLRENLGEDRVFTTKNWSPMASGLAGPVTITATR